MPKGLNSYDHDRQSLSNERSPFEDLEREHSENYSHSPIASSDLSRDHPRLSSGARDLRVRQFPDRRRAGDTDCKHLRESFVDPRGKFVHLDRHCQGFDPGDCDWERWQFLQSEIGRRNKDRASERNDHLHCRGGRHQWKGFGECDFDGNSGSQAFRYDHFLSDCNGRGRLIHVDCDGEECREGYEQNSS